MYDVYQVDNRTPSKEPTSRRQLQPRGTQANEHRQMNIHTERTDLSSVVSGNKLNYDMCNISPDRNFIVPHVLLTVSAVMVTEQIS